MSDYLRSIGLYLAMFFMVFTLAGFIFYYTNVSSMKQDTYKDFMYSGMNKSTLRLQGAEELADGNLNAYYLDTNGSYNQLNNEIIKQIGMQSKFSGAIEYELIFNSYTTEYFLHIKSSEVDSVIKFVLEDGRE